MQINEKNLENSGKLKKISTNSIKNVQILLALKIIIKFPIPFLEFEQTAFLTKVPEFNRAHL